jgi:hypothetical protein
MLVADHIIGELQAYAARNLRRDNGFRRLARQTRSNHDALDLRFSGAVHHQGALNNAPIRHRFEQQWNDDDCIRAPDRLNVALNLLLDQWMQNGLQHNPGFLITEYPGAIFARSRPPMSLT